MKKNIKKLELNRQTIRALNADMLSNAVGGGSDVTLFLCPPTKGCPAPSADPGGTCACNSGIKTVC